jgi:hypothetical protein
MPFGDQLGIAGLIVAVLGIGIAILWPRKAVGWACIVVAVILCGWWGVLEIREPQHPEIVTEKLLPTITWADPSPIEGGTPLSKKQLNATATVNGREVKGEYIYDPTFGTTPQVGTGTLRVTFIPIDQQRYFANTKNVALKVTSKRQFSKIPPSPATAPNGPVPVIVPQQEYGNLKDRTAILAQRIMADLYFNGWPERRWLPQFGYPKIHLPMPPPNTPLREDWIAARGAVFRAEYFKQALDIRNEFVQLHLRDNGLDQFFSDREKVQEEKQEMARSGLDNTPQYRMLDRLFPMQIEDVAVGLWNLAQRI